MKENLFEPDCMRTVSGLYVNVLSPDPATIIIEDIAHALARECRFGNHTLYHFSVAQHCLTASRNIIDRYALDMLMHDASEAYLRDIARPAKVHMPQYKVIEDILMAAIASKFGFQWPMPDLVKQVDELMLKIEWRSFVLKGRRGWPEREAKMQFMKRFKQLAQCQ